MDRLLQFVCDNSELYQFSVVLKRFVEQQDQVPDTNYLESIQLVLQTLEKSQHLSEDLVTKVLREVCWPIVYSRSDGSQRKKLHLCYDIVALCCSVYPTKILSEVHEKSLEILRRYVSEKSATDENAHDVSVTLDLIGNLVKPEAFESGEETGLTSGEFGDELFKELLNLLPCSTEKLCAKLTGAVLPHFLKFKRTERCEAVWHVVKLVFQNEETESTTKTFAILCGLADFFCSPGNSYNLFDKPEFWEMIQNGIVLNEPLSRKRSMYLLKRSLDVLDKQLGDLSVVSKKGNRIFYWASTNKNSLRSLWQDFVLIMETLDEKQAHIIKPVLPRISSIVDATKNIINGEIMLDISWLLTLYYRAAQHDNKFICRWAILDLLSMDLSCSPLLSPCYWWFLYGPLMRMLSEYNIYARSDDDMKGDAPAVGMAVVTFFTSFAERLQVNNRPAFCAGLLSAIVRQEFTQVPLVFMSQMLASLPSCPAWDSEAVSIIRGIFPLFRTFNPHMTVAIQSFLLKAVINLTNTRRVSWTVLSDFLSLFSTIDCLCRGNDLWEATVNFVENIRGSVCHETTAESGLTELTSTSNLFDHLKSRIEAFLNDQTPVIPTSDSEAQSVIRLLVILCDAHLKFSKKLTTKQPVQEILQQIVTVIHHASSHVYAPDRKTERAAILLSGILHHLNSTAAACSRSSSQKTVSVGNSKLKVDNCAYLMCELLRSSGPDMLELLLRKLTTAAMNVSHADFSFAFLDLANELYIFMTANIGGQEVECYYHFIDKLIQKSRKMVLDKQSGRQHLTLSDWRSFALSMKCLAFCCNVLKTEQLPSSSYLMNTLLQTIAELDLSSEFPKPKFLYPGEEGDHTSTEASPLIKKGWGRLVSDVLEAQWLCVGFLIEESQRYTEDKDQEMKKKLENFLVDLPETTLKALSLGSGQAILPVIKCVRLLTPRMLLKDASLCSRALESVWWTFQNRQKGDHIWFWGTLRETTQVLFSPCLLTLPEDHPITAIVRKYWAELLAMGEDRPGIVNHVIEPCCKFWTSSHCDYNHAISASQFSEGDRKQSLEVHLDFIIEASIFGPSEKKTIRVTNFVLEYVHRLSEQYEICPVTVNELRDDTRVRVNAINTLMMLSPKDPRDSKLLQRVIHALIAKNSDLLEDKPRSSINSYAHRRKHRVWQAVLVSLSLLLEEGDATESFFRQVLERMFGAILGDNQVSVRNFVQWGLVLILGRFPNLLPFLWEQLKYQVDRRSGSVFPLLVVAAVVGEFSFSDSSSQTAYFRRAFPTILPWVLASHVMVQAYAQVALQKMWLTCQRQNLREVMSDYAVIESCVNFLESSNEGLRQKVRVLGDFFFLDLHPYLDFSVQTLYEILPRLAEVTDEEWISPNGFMNGTLGMRVWKSHGDGFHRLKLINPDDTRLSKLLDAPRYNYEEGIGEQIMRRLTGKAIYEKNELQGNDVMCRLQSGDVQKKIRPWKVVPPDEEMMSEIQQQRMVNMHKNSAGNLIVVASLIDKAPNLGGLCRTCEIFGVQTLVLSNSHVIEDIQFKSLSVSAAKWMNLQEVRISSLKSYLESMRHEGYTLIGVEQTANSESLTRYQFPHKTLLLLGNEKEGIPVDLIQMLDVCVEIPQVGIIRSLNVHVSGALIVWEYTRQRLLEAGTRDHMTTDM